MEIIRFLIIEDDDHKSKRIEDCLRDHEVIRARSRNVGVRMLISEDAYKINGVILDMGLSIFDDGHDYNEKSGFFVLSEMDRRDINIPVMIHSGNEFGEVFEYTNVHSYIIADAFVSVSAQVKTFVDYVQTTIKPS